MTGATVVLCDYCGAAVAAGETFTPYAGRLRCRDTGACGRRQLRAFDPSILADEDLPVPPAASAPDGAACAVCRAASDLYERIPRSGQYVCRDRAGCQQRAVDYQYLHAWSDSSPDRLISAAEMRAQIAAAGPQTPAAPVPAGQDELAAEAWRSAMGRKRAG